MEFRNVVRLTICTGEDVFVDNEPLYKFLPKKIEEMGLAGVTVLKAEFGYANTHRGVGSALGRFFSGKADKPIFVEVVDTRENIEKILPFLEKNAHSALVTVRKTTILVTDYMRRKEAEQMKQQENCGPQMQIQQQQ